jgi:transcriptional regulator with XRE-family HTH domain
MKTRQAAAVPDEIALQFRDFGARLARLRIARHMRQEEAAIRAGFSRSTAVAIEKGAPSVAIGQVFRYLEAIAPGKTLDKLLNETDSAVLLLAASEQRQRARKQSDKALKTLDC